MSFKIMRSDPADVRADAVVITAGRESAPGTGMDRIVYEAGDSRRIPEARKRIGVIEPGHAAVTRPYGLSSRYLIHTAVPVWQGGGSGELETVRSCYRESLRLARKIMCRTVAFPLFPKDGEGYPGDKVLEIAVSCFKEYLNEHEMDIYLIIGSTDDIVIPEAEDMGIDTFIRKSFRKSFRESFREPVMESASYAPSPRRGRESARPHGALAGSSFQRDKMRASQPSLSYFMTHVGENFREMLLRLIDEKGFSDPYVYKKANLDRKLFSKIRCNPDYCPSRKTVIALAIALELTLDETSDLLSRAGYAFSPGSKADLIVEFCILNKIYDIFEVDMLLFKYGQPTLG